MKGRVFGTGKLGRHLEDRLRELSNEVHSEPRNQLLNVNPTEYIEYLVHNYSVEPVVLHLDRMVGDYDLQQLPLRDRPANRDIDLSGSIEVQVITYEIPFSGSRSLIWPEPSPTIGWTREVQVMNDVLSFEVANRNDDTENIKREVNDVIVNMNTQAQHSARQVEAWNAGLRKAAEQVFHARRDKHLKDLGVMEALGVPIKQSENVPATFSIPVEKKTVVIQKPRASAAPFSPEYTLAASIYQSILQMCYDFGVEMERHPGIYRDRTEPDIRDFFIMMLSPHFQSTTGETFNCKGKTDILVRHEGKNAFVAECKKWRGVVEHHKNINQALSYLTWRDSKAALIYFIEKVNLQPVLDKIVSETKTHPCHVEYEGQQEEGWYAFRLHLLGDDTRGVSFAILCFHCPKKAGSTV